MVKKYTSMAYAKADDMLFGNAKFPVKAGLASRLVLDSQPLKLTTPQDLRQASLKINSLKNTKGLPPTQWQEWSRSVLLP